MNLVFQVLILLGIGKGVMNSRMNPPPLGFVVHGNTNLVKKNSNEFEDVEPNSSRFCNLRTHNITMK